MRPNLEEFFASHGLREKASNILTKYGVTFPEIEKTNKKKTRGPQHIALARQELIRFTKMAFPMWSTPALGKRFGLDHTTIIPALKKDGAHDLYRTTEDAAPATRKERAGSSNGSAVHRGREE